MTVVTHINIGSLPNDHNGDDLRTSFNKCNNNWDAIENLVMEMAGYGVVAYDAGTTYNFPNAVVGSDGNVYRCMSTNIHGENPVGSVTGNWLNVYQLTGYGLTVYNPARTYNYPDAAIGSDNNEYRCMSTNIHGENPVGSVTGNWVIITDIISLTLDTQSRIKFVNTISDLRNLTPSATLTAVQPLGYYSAGDGGGGPERVGLYGAAPGTYTEGNGYTLPTGSNGSTAWWWGNQESINVRWCGAKGDLSDDSAAFIAAQGSGNVKVTIGPGSYSISNVTFKNGVVYEGAGYENTKIYQRNNIYPAFYVHSVGGIGQLNGVGIKNLTIIGDDTVGAGSAVTVEAATPYVVYFSNFDYHTKNTRTALKIICGTDNEVYSNKFSVYADKTNSTAFITKGVYNIYTLESINTGTGLAIDDGSINSTFLYAVADGTLQFGGQQCTIHNPTVEGIYGTAASDTSAIRLSGYNHTVINPTITNVPTAKCNYGINVFNKHQIFNMRTWGANTPDYPIKINSGAAPVIIGGQSESYFKMDQYVSASLLSGITFLGDCSSFTYSSDGYRNPFLTISAAAYTIDGNKSTSGLDVSIINNTSAGLTVTLPSYGLTSRELRFINKVAQAVESASSNIVQLDGTTNTHILAGSASLWVGLSYGADGKWHVVAKN